MARSTVAGAMSAPASTLARRGAAIIVACVLLLAVAILAVPPIARWQLASTLSAALARPTTIGSVGFDPLDLRLTLRDVAIEGAREAPPLLAVDEIDANLSIASIRHRGLVLDALRVVRPRLSLSRDHDGRYSIDDLIDRALAPSHGPPPRFSLNNVEVEDGTIAFDDGVTGRSHVVAALDLGLPFLSSLPYETAIRVTPRASGRFNGSAFALAGQTTPFATPPEATLDIDLDALPLRDYLDYAPVKPRVVLAGGTLSTRLTVAFVDGPPAQRRLELRGDARIDGLAIDRRDGTRLAGAERIAVAIDRVDVTGRDARVASIVVDRPMVDVRRLADGSLEASQPLVEASARATPDTSSREGSWTFNVATAALREGRVAIADASTDFRTTLVDVGATLSQLSNAPGAIAGMRVAFATSPGGAAVTADVDVDFGAPSASGHVDVRGLPLATLAPYYREAVAAQVQSGALDFASAFAVGNDGAIRISGGEASLTDLALLLAGDRRPLWRLPKLAARGIDVDVAARSATIAAVEGRGASVRVVRESEGTFEMARVLHPAKGGEGGGTWSVDVHDVALDQVAVDIEDRAASPPLKLALRDLAIRATGIANRPGTRSTFTLRTRVAERGRLSLAGALTARPLALDARVEATGLPLTLAKPYVEPHVNVVIAGGAIGAHGRLTLDAAEAGDARVAWKGDVVVSDFASLDAPTGSDLARFASLAFEGLDAATNPLHVDVARIAADDFYARLVIHPDGSLNVARLLAPGDAASSSAGSATPAAPATAATQDATVTEGAIPVSIGRIDVARGNVNFSDNFIRPNYSANLTDLAGSVTTMSARQAGDVALSARVDRSAPVEIAGRVNPFAAALSLDIAAKARDVDLPPLTPYAVKYAGYGIEKGKLTFEVRYRVEDRKLAAENHLVLDQLTFGDRVESPTATRLPVLLAVALLKDGKGVIDINLPIAGSLDDPQFSVGGLIVRVIVNLITKAVTAPFALLSAAFGRGEELSTLPFDAGSAVPGDDAQRRIDTLAKALVDRPGLKLEIGGHADGARDREALRRAAVETQLRRAKMKALAKEDRAPASVDLVRIDDAERERWLKDAYRDSTIVDRPRNVLGMLKDVPPAQMDSMLYAAATADDDALRALAARRSQAVKDALVAKGIASERLFVTAPRIGGDPADKAGGGAATRVDLALK